MACRSRGGLSRRLRDLDWPGIFYAGAGFGLLYAALDQGNRLDWLNSGLIVGLLVSGGLLTLLFIARELISPQPFLNIRVIARENLIPLLLLLSGFRFIILSTAYIIPNYLQTVQNFRELQVGSVLLWIALPQFLIVLPLGYVLKRVDGRYVLALGNLMIGIACLMATNLTSEWVTEDFPALANSAGPWPVVCFDQPHRACHQIDLTGRCPDDRKPAAVEPSLRRRNRHILHADVRPH